MSNDEVKDYVKSVNDSTPDEPDWWKSEYSRMTLSEFVTLGTHHYFHLVTSNKVTEDSKIEINQNMFLESRDQKFENGEIRKILTVYVNYNCFTELNFEKFDSPNLNKYQTIPLPKQFKQDLDEKIDPNERQKYLKSELRNIIKKEIITTPLIQFLKNLDNYITMADIKPEETNVKVLKEKWREQRLSNVEIEKLQNELREKIDSPNELIKNILILLSPTVENHARFLKNIIIENCEKYLRIFLVCLYIFSNERTSIFIWNRFNQSWKESSYEDSVSSKNPHELLFELLVPAPDITAQYIPSNFGNSNLDFQRDLFDYYEPPSTDEIFTMNQNSIENFHKLIDFFNENQDDKTQQLITSLLYFQSAIEGSKKYNMTNYLLVAACTDNIFTKDHKALNTRFGISQLHIYSLKVILKRLNDKNDFDLRHLMTDLRNDIAHGKIDYDTNLSFNNIDEDFRKLTEITKLILKYLIESTIGENKTSLNETINEIIDDAKKLAKEEHPEWSI